MSNGWFKQSLAVAMTLLMAVSSTLWAAGPEFTGNLRTSGTVLANSIPLPDGSTVRSGDRISTRAGALARISSNSFGRLEIRSASEATVAGDHLALHNGAAAATNLPIEVDGFTIRPQNPAGAWFAVAKRDGRLLVAAHRGQVLIASAGAATLTLPEGAFAARGYPQTKDSEKDKEQEKDKKRGAAAAGAATGGWTIGGLGHAASVALVVGIGAGVAATAAGLAVSLGGETPSP